MRADPDVVVADRSVDGVIASRQVLAAGFRPLERIAFLATGGDGERRPQDILRAGPAAAVLPLDPVRHEIVLLRQFRVAAHVANGKGDLVEIVAGHVEAHETPAETARRECVEEIGLVPSPLIELFSYFTSPGLLDEETTMFLGIVDASRLAQLGGLAGEGEKLHLMRVHIDGALAALADRRVQNGPLIIALQWLALNRARLDQILASASA
jgi:ADP-ribose pyrophosphatase